MLAAHSCPRPAVPFLRPSQPCPVPAPHITLNPGGGAPPPPPQPQAPGPIESPYPLFPNPSPATTPPAPPPLTTPPPGPTGLTPAYISNSSDKSYLTISSFNQTTALGNSVVTSPTSDGRLGYRVTDPSKLVCGADSFYYSITDPSWPYDPATAAVNVMMLGPGAWMTHA